MKLNLPRKPILHQVTYGVQGLRLALAPATY